MMRCAMIVAKREPARPSQCKVSRGTLKLRIGDTVVAICRTHRRVIDSGRMLEVTR